MSLEFELELGIGVLALVVAAYGLVARALSRRSVSAAFAFTAIGAMLGGTGLGMVVDVLPGMSVLSLVAEVTLALVLFTAASTIDIRNLEQDSGPVVRLLAIGLPLTIVAGTLLALGFYPGISFGLALLIGTILAPTDADLGQQVITDESVPARIRRILSIESGLNDGIAAPVVTVAIALATVGTLEGTEPVLDAIGELALAGLVGSGIGLAGGWLLIRSRAAGVSSGGSRRLTVLALAIGAYVIASALEGSGFIAAFCAGLGFGRASHHSAEESIVFAETQSVLLSIVVWLIFGLVVMGGEIVDSLDPMIILYALLSLTLLRMIPVAISLLGQHFDRVTVAFVGWFGPRGLASIVFVLLSLEVLESAGVDSYPLGPVVGWTIFISVILHGFSARPLARWYGRYATRLDDGSPESIGDHEPRRKGTMWAIHTHQVPKPGSTEPPR